MIYRRVAAVGAAESAFEAVAARCEDVAWLEHSCRKIKRWRRGPDGGHIREQIEKPLGADPDEPGSALVFDGLQSAEIQNLLRLHRPQGRGELRLMQANGILAAPGYQCAVHFDPQTIVTLQVQGEKRWSLQQECWLPGTPTVGWLDPAKHDVLAHELAGRMLTPPVLKPQTSQNRLRPGGALLIPRGWWHSSWSERKSLSLTLTYLFAD
jgi:hypothetical protein